MIGTIFEGTYTPEAAEWCNKNNCFIQEIEPLEDGTRRFEVKEVVPYQESEEEREERIGNLYMSRGDMFEALILAFDKDENDIIKIVEDLPDITDMERKLYLNRVKNAQNFYRKYPAVDLIGTVLGISKEKMDNFFESKNYQDLLAKV